MQHERTHGNNREERHKKTWTTSKAKERVPKDNHGAERAQEVKRGTKDGKVSQKGLTREKVKDREDNRGHNN